MKHLILGFFFLSSSLCINQELAKSTVNLVFDNIIQSIGNNNPRPPSLLISETSNNPAVYYPITKKILIEQKVLEICHGFGKDSLNALSYILAHELAHHYNNHDFLAKYATLDFSNEVDQEIESSQQRIDDESEADIYAGFFSHIAGYDALSVAEQFLDQIYAEYNLPHTLPNYPTLIERKTIIQKNKEDFEILRTIFDNANILMALGEYVYAQDFFEYILNKGFTSREIYNNLGLCYIYEALDLGVEAASFEALIPFQIDLSSRIRVSELGRGLSVKEKALNKLNRAIQYFEIALEQDKEYDLSKQNIYFAQIAMSYLTDDVSFQFDSDQILSLPGVCQTCVLGHESIINHQLKKAKRYFKNGSNSCDICAFNIDFKVKKEQDNFTNTEADIIIDEEKIDTYCLDFIPDDCDVYHKVSSLQICNRNVSNSRLIQLKKRTSGRLSCMSIVELSSKKDILENKSSIYINDSFTHLLNKYQNLNIISAGLNKYVSIIGQPIAFFIENDVVKKIYYTQKM